jgi:hypothetical protein
VRNKALIKKGFGTMNKQQASEIFGLNFLQEMKGTPDPITGGYDPEQEIWIMEGQVQAMPIPKLPGPQPGPGVPGIEFPHPGPRGTRRETRLATHRPDGRADSAFDMERD